MRTLSDLYHEGLARPKERHLNWRDAGGAWRSLSTREVQAEVEAVAAGLAARGLAKGERVAILSRNSPRWAIADYAVVTSGLVDVPIYPTLAPDQTKFLLADSGARVLLLEDAAQHARLRSALEGTALETVVLMSGEEAQGTIPWEALRRGAAPAPAPPLEERDVATIIYTSGTTAVPKGVMLTHGNLVSNAEACARVIDLADVQQVNLSLLPLSHVFQRLVDYFLFLRHAETWYCPNPLEAQTYLAEVRPTFFAAVPRLYEKVHAGARSRLAQSPGPVRALAAWAEGVGKRRFHAFYRGGACDGRPGPLLALEHALADRLVLSRLRSVFGGRVDVCFSGGAPLPAETHEWLLAIGMNLLPGYGLTETAPVLSTNRRRRMKLGSVGPPLPGVEIEIAPDGEILARGPNVMPGYWNRPEETAAALEGGWFHTGDLGRRDEQGYLHVVGRKKELLVLMTGKKVVPAAVEDKAMASPLVRQCVAVGDERKFVACLVHPNLDTLAALARARGLPFGHPSELLGSREAVGIVLESVAAACASLSDFEIPKAVAFLPRELSMAEGELTPTLKIKRREVAARWKALIDGLYGERAS